MIPHHLPVGKGKTVFNAIIVTVDDTTGKATGIERIVREVD